MCPQYRNSVRRKKFKEIRTAHHRSFQAHINNDNQSLSIPWSFWNFVDAVQRNHVIKISKFTVKSSYLGYLRRKLLLVKFDIFIGKSNFYRVHPRYDDFIIIAIFPTIRCIDSNLKKKLPEKIFLTENTLFMIFDQNKFSTEILKNCLLLTSKGHLALNKHQ